MANCPNCGSHHIQLKRETDVNWGRAIVGYAVFGIVGGAVGAVTGEDRNVNACLDCGTSWRASDLYNVLQVIKKLTGQTLNLANEEDRLYMNEFIAEILPHIDKITLIENMTGQTLNLSKKQDRIYMNEFIAEVLPHIDKITLIENIIGQTLNLYTEDRMPYIKNFVNETNLYINEITEIEKKGEELIKEVEKEGLEITRIGCLSGCLAYCIFAIILSIFSVASALPLIMLIIILCMGVGIDKSKHKKIDPKKAEINKKIFMMKENAMKKLSKQVKLLMKKYSIN